MTEEVKGIDPGEITQYRRILREEFDLIYTDIRFFLLCEEVSTDTKLEKISEMLCFFISDKDFERIEALNRILDLIKIKSLVEGRY